MNKKGKLELTWVGKEDRVRLEPRVLVENPDKSYGDPKSENMLVYGDNLLALKALEQEYAGQVKCVATDPPYNTGSAFTHYEDGLEHSIWLSMMQKRFLSLYPLINESGCIFVCLDDNEAHYCKVVLDEIFGRRNFVGDIAWQKKYSPGNNQKGLSSDYDHILLYAKEIDKWDWKLLPRTEKQDKAYRNPDNDHRGLWKASDLTRAEHRDRDFYPIMTPSGKEAWPAKGRSWSRPPAEIERLRKDNQLWFGPNGDSKPSLKRFLSEVQDGVVARGIWLRDEVGDNEEAKKEGKILDENDIFPTPKPERLIYRMITMSTNPGDLVLDSFAGSGTTGAVAHKMGRRWIMCELGEHCHTHIIPRMKKVIDGTDQGGISESVNWKGGGGFKYYHLAESLLVRDKELSTKNHPVYTINPRYNEQMLIKAICKIENFKYRNSGRLHGISSESRFLHVTTRLINQAYIDSLADDLTPNQSLLIYSTRRMRGLKLPDNIELKKIPRDLLEKCDFQEEKK